ncbi:MAG: hypothetical protein JWN34_5657 [Bryobacterales bacterium]|nr:hypothetical protein [Bryobacterales bacterium]
MFAAAAGLFAQDAAPASKASPYISVIGSITKADAAGKVLSVKSDKGDETTVKFNELTSFLRMAAGETDMKKATEAKASDAEVGDRVIARVLTTDPTGKPARTIYITKQADLAKRTQDTMAQWKNATKGLATNVDAGAKAITITSKQGATSHDIKLDVSGKVDFRHYNPETGQYEAGTMAAIRTGDQILVLGQKEGDGSSIKAESIGFGSFKTIGILVKSIDTAGNVILGTETASKKPITVTLRPDTSVKKFSEMGANMVARMVNPTFQAAGGRGGFRGAPAGGDATGGAGGGAEGPARPAGPPAGTAAAPGAPGEGRGVGRGGRGGRGGMDIGAIIEQQPSIQLSELKVGDALIVTGATGADATKLIASAVVAGVEPILRAAPSNGADPLAGAWNVGGGGGGGDGN